MDYIDEISPLTQEQWDRVTERVKRRSGSNALPVMQSARGGSFSEGLNQVQAKQEETVVNWPLCMGKRKRKEQLWK